MAIRPDESGTPPSTAAVSEITFILITVSLLIVLGTAFFKVDFVPAVLLGCLVVVLNFYLTRRILSRLLMFKGFETAYVGSVSLQIGYIRNRLILGNCSISSTWTCSIDRIVEYFDYHVGFCD